MRKKFAVFSATWNADYLYPFLQGMKQGAREREADLYIFNSYGDSDREYESFTSGEYNVFFLPDLTEFDGALIAANNVGSEPWVEQLGRKIRQLGIPCVGVEQPSGMEHIIGVDNYRAMCAVVEHLVRVKGCRVLNYETGEWGEVYDWKKLSGRDPYETFLSGSVSLLRIENPYAETDRELIVFRDSFGSALAPLLCRGYRTVTLVDLRYLSGAMLSRFLDFHGQDVLFLYSTLVLNNSSQLR